MRSLARSNNNDCQNVKQSIIFLEDHAADLPDPVCSGLICATPLDFSGSAPVYVCGMYMYIHRIIIIVHVTCQHNIYENASLVYIYVLPLHTCT